MSWGNRFFTSFSYLPFVFLSHRFDLAFLVGTYLLLTIPLAQILYVYSSERLQQEFQHFLVHIFLSAFFVSLLHLILLLIFGTQNWQWNIPLLWLLYYTLSATHDQNFLNLLQHQSFYSFFYMFFAALREFLGRGKFSFFYTWTLLDEQWTLPLFLYSPGIFLLLALIWFLYQKLKSPQQ